jgi:hypothetical protein
MRLQAWGAYHGAGPSQAANSTPFGGSAAWGSFPPPMLNSAALIASLSP